MEGIRGLRGPDWPAVVLGLMGLALGLGIGLLLGARRRPERMPGPARRPAPVSLEPSDFPMESWRGSGLAEDVGVEPHASPPEPDEEERQRRMREAREQLGLPDPDAWGARSS